MGSWLDSGGAAVGRTLNKWRQQTSRSFSVTLGLEQLLEDAWCYSTKELRSATSLPRGATNLRRGRGWVDGRSILGRLI
jgi:hypothetical protein